MAPKDTALTYFEGWKLKDLSEGTTMFVRPLGLRSRLETAASCDGYSMIGVKHEHKCDFILRARLATNGPLVN